MKCFVCNEEYSTITREPVASIVKEDGTTAPMGVWKSFDGKTLRLCPKCERMLLVCLKVIKRGIEIADLYEEDI